MVVQPLDFVHQVSDLHIFYLIAWAGPLAHLWEVLSYPVQLQPTLGFDLNFTSESQGEVLQHSEYLETFPHLTSSVPLRSAEIHSTEFKSAH